jgi:pilus assembly protein CpaF
VEILNCEDGEIELNPLYRFREEGEGERGNIIGTLHKTNQQMIQIQKLLRAGQKVE